MAIAFESSANTLNEVVSNLFQQSTSAYSQALLGYWKSGLALVDPSQADQCPMCEEKTLPESKRSELSQRIESARSFSDLSEKLAKHAQL